jgi:multimeric flavodoxin WrbA
MGKILAINGSYRENGITDQAVEEMVRVVEAAGNWEFGSSEFRGHL